MKRRICYPIPRPLNVMDLGRGSLPDRAELATIELWHDSATGEVHDPESGLTYAAELFAEQAIYVFLYHRRQLALEGERRFLAELADAFDDDDGEAA